MKAKGRKELLKCKSPLCDSATARQRSSHNALGQDEGDIITCPMDNLPSTLCKDIPEEVLEDLLELLGGRKTGGWMRLRELLYCKARSWWDHLQSHLMDGNPASAFGKDTRPLGDEKNHQLLELPEAIWTFQLDSSGKTKALPS